MNLLVEFPYGQLKELQICVCDLVTLGVEIIGFATHLHKVRDDKVEVVMHKEAAINEADASHKLDL